MLGPAHLVPEPPIVKQVKLIGTVVGEFENVNFGLQCDHPPSFLQFAQLGNFWDQTNM